MARMTLEELRSKRNQMKNDLEKRETDGKSIQIIVGMGTCGIAAGAKNTLEAFIRELDKAGVGSHAIIRQTGCMGMCSNEPTVEVIVPEMPAVIYGNVSADVAGKIVESHIVGRKLLDNLILDKPSADIIR